MAAAGGDSHVTLGHVARPNGLRGAVVAHCDASTVGLFAKGLAIELRLRDGSVVRTRIGAAARVRGGVRLTLENVEDRNRSEQLVGATIAARRDELALGENEVFDTDLVGLEVVTRAGEALGRLTEVIATGANDVYVVTREGGGEVLVPATAHAEIEIDLVAGKMTVAGDALEYGEPKATRSGAMNSEPASTPPRGTPR